MSVTANDLQNLIITSLSNADPTALAGLQTNVPRYWLLWARQGVLPELRYWYTRRDAIRYLMACLNQQTDYARRAQNATRALNASSLNNDSMTATAAEYATSLANRSSASNYSDATNSSGSGSSISNRSSAQTMNASSVMSDTGSGANAAHNESTMASSSSVNAASCDSMVSEQSSVNDVTGFREHKAWSDKRAVGASAFGAGATFNFSSTYQQLPLDGNYNRSITTRTGESESTARQSDTRANAMTQAGAQTSSSSFNANRTNSNTMTATGSSVMTGSSTSTFSMSGSGAGSMTGTGAGGSTMTASSSRVATSRGEAHRLAVAASTSNSTMERLHQRFLHLQDLWQKSNAMIQWFESQRLNLAPYVMQTITIQYPAGLNADAANLYLVKTPFGVPQL